MATDLVLQPTEIIHFSNQERVKAAPGQTQINNAVSPMIVIAEAIDYNKRHVQIRVLPFDGDHADKEALPFMEKVALFPKEIRNAKPEEPTVKQVVAKDPSVATLITNFFDQTDGYADELAEFMDGWNNMPVTGYEANMPSFFSNLFVPLASADLSEFNVGLSS